ncbi:Nif3-like dinuclear metal center hexameric protein [Terrisporobacter sp.]|uniref:Nif3-like dinuclear metal center hexameric protein n=1 Tax=Terrisporobacter sp. TaxID=1965305 RepID=UPI00261625BD|nr:Nif3-like dinuclear metal center hexameric protein [Terrisporobacter sp.]
MKLNSLIKKIENKYPLNLAYSWDNVGLIVGDFDNDIKKVLVTLEANESIIEEAIENKIDLIVTHHPFIFKKINKINTKDLKGRLIHKLIKNDIALYSMHTNFDIAVDGLNDYFMEIMGFENTKILDVTYSDTLYKIAVYVPISHELIVREALGEAGAGYIGNYSHCTFNTQGIGTFKPEDDTNPFIGTVGEIENVKEVKIETIVPSKLLQKSIDKMLKVHPYEEVAYDVYKLENKGESVGLGRYASLNDKISLQDLCEEIKLKLNMDHIRVVGELYTKIKKVAVVTGAGSDMISLAKSKNCDVIITGDVKYHEAQDALDMDMCIIDCGHFDTEDIFKDVMKRFLDELEDVEVIKSEVNLNPFKII